MKLVYFPLLTLFILNRTYPMYPNFLTSYQEEFLQAAVEGKLPRIKILKRNVPLNTMNQFGDNAFFKAVFFKKWRVARFLMKNGININDHPYHKNNTTFLHSLCYEHSPQAIALLRDALTFYHADPNPLDRYNDTPLDRAYEKSNKSLHCSLRSS